MGLFKDQNIELKGRKDEEWNDGESCFRSRICQVMLGNMLSHVIG